MPKPSAADLKKDKSVSNLIQLFNAKGKLGARVGFNALTGKVVIYVERADELAMILRSSFPNNAGLRPMFAELEDQLAHTRFATIGYDHIAYLAKAMTGVHAKVFEKKLAGLGKPQQPINPYHEVVNRNQDLKQKEKSNPPNPYKHVANSNQPNPYQHVVKGNQNNPYQHVVKGNQSIPKVEINQINPYKHARSTKSDLEKTLDSYHLAYVKLPNGAIHITEQANTIKRICDQINLPVKEWVRNPPTIDLFPGDFNRVPERKEDFKK